MPAVLIIAAIGRIPLDRHSTDNPRTIVGSRLKRNIQKRVVMDG